MLNIAEAEISTETAAELLDGIDRGFALPSSWYADPGIFARERTMVLRRGWQFAAHTGQLAKVGDQVTCEIAGVPVVLVVDKDAQIRGFVNICRHRAHIVVQRDGCRGTLQCMYHGWTYNLDGGLRRAPRADSEADFDTADFGLTPVQTAVWGPTVWVNVDRDAPSFWSWIEGLPEFISDHGVDIENHRFAFERSWQVGANWKVFLDNAIECYHCPTCHPSLTKVLTMDPAVQEIFVGGRYWSGHSIPLRASATGTNVAAPTGATSDGNYYYHWIFPTTYFQYAGGGFDIGTLTVRDVNDIVFRHLTFLPVGTDAEEVAARELRLDEDPTASEDVAICHRVQAAHESGVAPPGRLLPRSEWLLLHFQRILVEDLAGIAPEYEEAHA